MQQLENELAQTQTNLETATHNLEEKEKALQNVSFFCKKSCERNNIISDHYTTECLETPD